MRYYPKCNSDNSQENDNDDEIIPTPMKMDVKTFIQKIHPKQAVTVVVKQQPLHLCNQIRALICIPGRGLCQPYYSVCTYLSTSCRLPYWRNMSNVRQVPIRMCSGARITPSHCGPPRPYQIGGRDVKKKKHTARRITDSLVSLVLRTELLYYPS